MTNSENSARNKAVEDALKAIQSRSYAGRHPELGKMVNCVICDRRHRSSIVCKAVYAKDEEGNPRMAAQNTARGVYGAKAFAKKRYHPHPSKSKLQLVQRTRELYPQHQQNLSDPQECMESAREQAKEQLMAERRAERKFKRKQQQIARRINFGLAVPGSRA